MFVSRRTADTVVELGMQIGTSVSLFIGYVRQNRHPLFTLTLMPYTFSIPESSSLLSQRKKNSSFAHRRIRTKFY